MQRLSSATITSLCALSLMALPASLTSAYAGEGISDATEGGRDGNTIYSKAATVHYDTSKNGSGPSTGAMTVSDSDWSPPPCWYAPIWTPEQMDEHTERFYENTVNTPGQHSYAGRAAAEFREMYENGEYKDFNKGKEGEGMFWGAVENPNEFDVLARLSCNDKLPFWVDEGEEPPVENAIDPELLAGLAYQQIQVPDTDIELSPSEAQTVNLPTWAWLDRSTFRPVSVTASVEGLDISATTTATPVALKLQPGTKSADVHPSSGTCPINDDGSIGAPYKKGAADEDPPCGLTYLRSTADGESYELRATITWEVEWTGTGGTGGDLPDGTFGTTQDITVQEVQAINR